MKKSIMEEFLEIQNLTENLLLNTKELMMTQNTFNGRMLEILREEPLTPKSND